MDKKIEDYLHLYLGCECQYEYVTLSDIPSKKIEQRFGKLYGLRGNEAFISTHFGEIGCMQSRVKPILCPLSDMSEEDYAFINDGYNNSNKHSRYGSYYWEAEQTRYLLSKHFDLFNLHEAGL